MAETDQGERTEEATQQRREDFRRRGQVAQTRELGSVFLLFTSLIGIWLLGRFYLIQMNELFTSSFGHFLVESVRSGEYIDAIKFAGLKLLIMVGPVLGVVWLISFASGIVQVGFLYNEEALQFKPERLDPIQGFKRIFSMKSLVEGIKAILKLIFVAIIAGMVIKSELIRVPLLIHFTVEQMFSYLGDISIRLFGSIGFFMAVLSGVDFLFQRWDLEKEMMMTKQEVKEELKSREGDPLVKARIKRVQREMANKRMMEEIPKADVVITNPTHIAVVLKYDETMVAPRLVAKGADYLAERIKAIAKENKIPIVENKPVARAIYKTMKLGQTIPKELYTAIAEVLSYVYRLKKKVLS